MITYDVYIMSDIVSLCTYLYLYLLILLIMLHIGLLCAIFGIFEMMVIIFPVF